MGRTNLKEALERRYSALASELRNKQKRIDHIEGLFEEPPVLSKRAQRVEVLLGCADKLLKEIDPAWKRDEVKPRRANEWQGPLSQGDVAEGVLAILRETGARMSCRQLAIAVLKTSRHHRVRQGHAAASDEYRERQHASEGWLARQRQRRLAGQVQHRRQALNEEVRRVGVDPSRAIYCFRPRRSGL